MNFFKQVKGIVNINVGKTKRKFFWDFKDFYCFYLNFEKFRSIYTKNISKSCLEKKKK